MEPPDKAPFNPFVRGGEQIRCSLQDTRRQTEPRNPGFLNVVPHHQNPLELSENSKSETPERRKRDV